MKRKFAAVILLLIAVSISSMMQIANAAVIAEVPETWYSGATKQASWLHPTAKTTYTSAVGQSFTTNGTYNVGNVTFLMMAGALAYDCNGTYVARLYNATGGTGSKPTTPNGHFAQSNETYWGWDLPKPVPEGSGPDTVTFSFNNITLVAGNYTVAVVCTTSITPTYAGGRGAWVTYDSGGNSGFDGNLVYYTASAWTATTDDLIFTLFEYDEPYTPSPSTAPDSGTDALIATLMNYLIPIFTLLLPAFLLGWITHWAKWPIMIGLAIGSGLTYIFCGSGYLWLVFLVAVGLAAMVFSGRMRRDE